jgi:hypothetical protein
MLSETKKWRGNRIFAFVSSCGRGARSVFDPSPFTGEGIHLQVRPCAGVTTVIQVTFRGLIDKNHPLIDGLSVLGRTYPDGTCVRDK